MNHMVLSLSLPPPSGGVNVWLLNTNGDRVVDLFPFVDGSGVGGGVSVGIGGHWRAGCRGNPPGGGVVRGGVCGGVIHSSIFCFFSSLPFFFPKHFPYIGE